MRGRKPKPNEIKKRDGTYRADRHGDAPPLPAAPQLVEPPAELEDEAKEFWREAVPTLHEAGLLSRVDKPALEMLATQYARAKQAGRVVAEQGLLALGSAGQFRIHPAVIAEREATTQFLRLAEQYALTPVARTRLGLAEMQRQSIAQAVGEDLGQPELEPA